MKSPRNISRVFNHATSHGMHRDHYAMGTNEYLIKSKLFCSKCKFTNLILHTCQSVVCVDAKYTCFVQSVLHMAVFVKFDLAWSLPLSFKNV